MRRNRSEEESARERERHREIRRKGTEERREINRERVREIRRNSRLEQHEARRFPGKVMPYVAWQLGLKTTTRLVTTYNLYNRQDGRSAIKMIVTVKFKIVEMSL